MKKYYMRNILCILCMYALLSACTSQAYKTIGSVERIDPALDTIISKNALPEIIAEGFTWAEGPVWVNSQHMLLFSDIPPNRIYKWTESGGQELYLTPSGYTDSVKRGGEVGSNALLIQNMFLLPIITRVKNSIAPMMLYSGVMAIFSLPILPMAWKKIWTTLIKKYPSREYIK